MFRIVAVSVNYNNLETSPINCFHDIIIVFIYILSYGIKICFNEIIMCFYY